MASGAQAWIAGQAEWLKAPPSEGWIAQTPKQEEVRLRVVPALRVERPSVRIFKEMTSMVDQGREREAVFFVMREVDVLLSKQWFHACRELLGLVAALSKDVSPLVMGALLTITLAAKDRMGSSRTTLYASATERFLLVYGDQKTKRLLGHLQ